MIAPQKISIDTPRLIVSDFCVEDFPAFSSLFASLNRANQVWFNAHASDPESIKTFFNQIMSNQQDTPRQTYRLAIRRKDEASEATTVIGYVSLCDIWSQEEGRPDTGVLIDPCYQRGGYAREARLAIGHLATQLGLEKLFCDIKISNIASITNVVGMGYDRVMREGNPAIIKTTTIDGVEDWYRYQISKETLLEKLPHLVQGLADRHWAGKVSETYKSNSSIDDVFKVCSTADASCEPMRLPVLRQKIRENRLDF